MNAIFEKGPLGGHCFEVPSPPPKGLDVLHGDIVLRYGFVRYDNDDGAVYHFCERRWQSTWRSRPIWLGENLHGAALLFYPAMPANIDRPESDFYGRPAATLTKMPACDSHQLSFPSTDDSLERDTGE